MVINFICGFDIRVIHVKLENGLEGVGEGAEKLAKTYLTCQNHV